MVRGFRGYEKISKGVRKMVRGLLRTSWGNCAEQGKGGGENGGRTRRLAGERGKVRWWVKGHGWWIVGPWRNYGVWKLGVGLKGAS